MPERRQYTMNNSVKKILRNLINAQIASDGGKSVFELPRTEKEWAIAKAGYAAKDRYISDAIGLINSSRNCGIYFSVTFCPELSEWNDCYIVYFNIKINGKRYQVSYHSFDSRFEPLARYETSTRWTRKNSSRNILRELRELIES
jgi:hypothetical protein